MDQIRPRLEDNTLLRQFALVLLALGVGAAGGLAIVAGNPVVPFVALMGLVALPWLVTRPMTDMLLVVCTITLLPFAASPVRLAVLTPTLLEIGLLLLYMAWLLRMLLNTEEGFVRTPLDVWVVLLLACTLFAFVLGLGRDASTDVVHNYFKMLLSIGIFFAAANVMRTWEQVAIVLKALIVSGAAAASIGIVLWRLPDTLAASLLTRLSVIGYPTERVIRYVEENPTLGERAVGTQVDPNSFAGMLVIIAAITGVHLLSRRPLFPRWLLAGMLLVDVAAIVLTQSRSALLGILVAAALVATVRYRHLWTWGVAGAVAITVLGVGSGYFARLAAGIRFEDQASIMRLAEYRNALDIIGRYPAFGVGFGTAGELDLTTGVSSIYLTIAERTGLIGLALFLVVMVIFLAKALPAVVAANRHAPPPGSASEQEWSALDSALLGGTAALLGALLVGLVDHYYFNIEFPHTVALFWLAASLALTGRRLLMQRA
ncbi:MAG TPA: O-antigen ligase family protein [Chloroflexia bacterium]|nr:O-antigen ligase family protein [Chloroflexia bacterium]